MRNQESWTHHPCVKVVVVFAGLLALNLNNWATSDDGSDLPAKQTRPLSVAKELALANDYLFGRGVVQDSKLSSYWLQKAANAGDPEAQMEMGYFCEVGIGTAKNMEAAARWYARAAHGGHAEAKASLGVLYFWGTGVPEDREMAARLFREAAEKGVGIAAYQLGYMYAIGAGVPRDTASAEHWYAMGAKQHNPQAEYQLGLQFLGGSDHKVDLRKSEDLLRSSAESGFVPAMYELGLLLTRHPELAKSPGEARQFLDESAKAGLWKASEELGVLARDGNGMPRDDKAAYFRFRVAALQGGTEARENVQSDLERLTAQLDPTVTSALDSEAQAWYETHRVVLAFLYKKGGPGNYPVSALAGPKENEHQLQLLSTKPAGQAIDRGIQTADSIAK
jgi:TPR repeat protein